MNTTMRRAARGTALAAACSLTLVAIGATVSSPATAATQGISITKSGFVPMNQTIKVGDTISFTNADTDPHQVLFKQTSGFTCTATPLVVEPTKTQSCTFTAAAAYTYSDPNQKGSTFRGTITVEAPPATPTISLNADASVVEYGTKVNLTGKTSTSNAGTAVDLMALATGETNYTKVGTATTNASGLYSFSVAPEVQTTYRADFQSGGKTIMSSTEIVQVKPNVTLKLRFVKKAKAYFVTKVTSSTTYAAHRLQVQRQNRLGGWTTLRTVTLGEFSSIRFVIKLPKGVSKIRTQLTTAQAGEGFIGNTSNTVAVQR
jgi:plastocyanin